VLVVVVGVGSGANTYPVNVADCATAERPRDGWGGRRTVLRETTGTSARWRWVVMEVVVGRSRAGGLEPSTECRLLLERRRGKLLDADCTFQSALGASAGSTARERDARCEMGCKCK
jgi:hypothetical protein